MEYTYNPPRRVKMKAQNIEYSEDMIRRIADDAGMTVVCRRIYDVYDAHGRCVDSSMSSGCTFEILQDALAQKNRDNVRRQFLDDTYSQTRI